MLYFDSIDVSEGVDIDKTSASNECDICHQQYFLGKGFKFQSHVCNGCGNALMMSKSFSYIAILNTNSADYCCIIKEITKDEAVNLLRKADLKVKSVIL